MVSAVRFVASNVVIREFVGQGVAVCTPLLYVAADSATSTFDIAVALGIFISSAFS